MPSVALVPVAGSASAATAHVVFAVGRSLLERYSIVGPQALSPSAGASSHASAGLVASQGLSPNAGASSNASVQLACPVGRSLYQPYTITAAATALAPRAGTVAQAAASVLVRMLFALGATSTARASATVAAGPPQLAPRTLARAGAQVPLTAGVPISHAFDEIVIFDAFANQVAAIARNVGPLEAGYTDPAGTWIPATDPVELIIDGFAISAGGAPYYDTHQVDPGEQARLILDPVDQALWLLR